MSWALPAGRVIVPVGAPRLEWLQARAQGVTATDMRVLSGHGYAGESVYQRWLEKVSPVVDDPAVALALELGRDEEPVIAKHAARRYGTRVRRIGLVQHRDYPTHLASPDLISGDGGLVEGKVTGSWYLKQHADDGSEWTNADGWTLPPAWLTQARWQRHVSGRSHVHVFALIADRRAFTGWTVEPDEVEESICVELADELWRCVETDTPPPIDWDTITVQEVQARYPRPTRPSVVVPSVVDVAGLLELRRQLKNDEATTRAALEQIDATLKAWAGEATDVVNELGDVLYSYPLRQRAGYSVGPAEYRQLTVKTPRPIK